MRSMPLNPAFAFWMTSEPAPVLIKLLAASTVESLPKTLARVNACKLATSMVPVSPPSTTIALVLPTVKPVVTRRVPPLNVRFLVPVPRLASEETTSTPSLIKTPPPKVLVPPRVRVPRPPLATPTVPPPALLAMTELMVRFPPSITETLRFFAAAPPAVRIPLPWMVVPMAVLFTIPPSKRFSERVLLSPRFTTPTSVIARPSPVDTPTLVSTKAAGTELLVRRIILSLLL